MRSGRILVVDDEVNARTALAELLRDEGYEVETAADAFKALGKYEAFSPHVVVTDLKMPGMDGIELVKKIRAMEDAAAVVVMTAFGAVASAVDAMRAGAAEYLTKPLNFDELLVVLDKVFEQQALRRETRQLRVRVGAAHVHRGHAAVDANQRFHRYYTLEARVTHRLRVDRPDVFEFPGRADIATDSQGGRRHHRGGCPARWP